MAIDVLYSTDLRFFLFGLKRIPIFRVCPQYTNNYFMLCLDTLFWALRFILLTYITFLNSLVRPCHTFTTETTEYVRTGLQNYQRKGYEHIHFEMIWRLIRERLANMTCLSSKTLSSRWSSLFFLPKECKEFKKSCDVINKHWREVQMLIRYYCK